MRIKPTPYRDGQNVIKDSGTGTIVYMPPEAKDVGGLMRNLVSWIKTSVRRKKVFKTINNTHYLFK